MKARHQQRRSCRLWLPYTQFFSLLPLWKVTNESSYWSILLFSWLVRDGRKQHCQVSPMAQLLLLPLLSWYYSEIKTTKFFEIVTHPALLILPSFSIAGFAGDDAPRSVFPSLIGRARQPGIMVSLVGGAEERSQSDSTEIDYFSATISNFLTDCGDRLSVFTTRS